MKPKRIITIIIIVLIPVTIIIRLMSNKTKLDEAEKPVDRSDIAVKVIVDTVSLKTVDGSFTQPATIVAEEDAIVSAEVSGKITSLKVELGTMVKKGQIIGSIDVTETRQKLEEAELAIKKLNADYERNKVLLAGNATNATAVSDIKYELDAKKIEAAQLSTQISKATIVAPIDGVITDKQKVEGEFVNTGATVAGIANLRSLKANVSVPESRILYIRKGEKVSITSSAYPGEIFSAVVTYVSPKGDDNHNYAVQLTMTNTASTELKAGLYVEAQFSGMEKHSTLLMILKNALAEGVKNPIVYVYKKGVAEERKLVTGIESGDYIEVKNGLSKGELVVTSGQINLSNGTKIQIVKVK